MIYLEINKPGTILALPFRAPQQQHDPIRPGYWGKMPFIQLVEETKKAFRAGDLVTFSTTAPQKNVLPQMLGHIKDFCELHWQGQVDNYYNQPKIVFVEWNTNWRVWYAPKHLRLLTEEERGLAVFRDHPGIPSSPTH